MKKRFLLVCFILFLSGFLKAQVNDANLWVSLNAEKKFTPDLSLIVSQEFRMNENIGELGTFFTDVGFSYKFTKMIRASASYRFTNKRLLDDSYSKRHRYYFDISFRKKVKPFIFTLRTRFQSQFTDVFCSPEGKIPTFFLRNKFTVKFDLDKKYVPYFSAELFSHLFADRGFSFNDGRYSAGVEYQFNRKHGIDIFYLFQQEYNTSKPEKDFVAGIGYYYTF